MINLLLSFYRNFAHLLRGRYCQVILLFVALVIYSATGYMYFELPENPDLMWVDSLWWSIVTMTTVGYGDFFPASALGRILIGFPTMLLGIGIMGYMLSLVATAMLESKMMEVKGMKDIVLTDHIIICHLGALENTLNLLHELARDASTKDTHTVIVDADIDELPPELVSEKTYFLKGDPAREAVLTKAGISTAKAVIIQAISDDPTNSDNRNLRIALTVGSISPSTFTVAECISPENEVFFKRANCDSVVCIASLAGQMMIQELQDPGVGTIVSELTSNAHGKQFYVVDIAEHTEGYQQVQQRYDNDDVIIIGIRRGQENIILPKPDFSICQGDKAILISSGRPS